MKTNPYTVGPPLRSAKGFFGRQNIIDWVLKELSNPNTNALVLLGQRRIGKTSLLHQIRHVLPRNRFLAIYFDLQDKAEQPLGQVLADIADTIADELELEPFPVDAYDNRGRHFERTFLSSLYDTIGEGIRPVFLFDEFDVLDKLAEEQLPETAAAKAFFPFLRHLMNKDPRLAFVFVVGRRADDLSVDFTATFKTSLQQEIWVLERESTEALIRQGEGDGTLQFSTDAIERIIKLTNGHPYFTQLLCQRLWDNSHESLQIISPIEVDAVVPTALQMGNQALVWLWNGLSPAEKIYAAALAEVGGEKTNISEEHVIAVLAEYAPRLRTREVEMAPTDLVKRRVLDVVGDREYRFAIELFRRWVQDNKPLRDVKDEMDRVDELADQYFNIGLRLFTNREWQGAVDEFQRALTRYQHHFRARLYLGETYLELGRIDEAVTELEQAYELDKDETRLPLVRALIRQGHIKAEAGHEDLALSNFDRVLELSPREQTAKVARNKIWIARGDRAANENDLEAALEAYRNAEAPDKVREIEMIQRSLALQEQATTAEKFAKNKDWKKAAQIYKHLNEINPEEERWRQSLAQVEEEVWLAERYAEGIGYMQQEDWEQAVAAFREIVSKRPFYNDVVELLTEIKGKGDEIGSVEKLGQANLSTQGTSETNRSPLSWTGMSRFLPWAALGSLALILVIVAVASVLYLQNQQGQQPNPGNENTPISTTTVGSSESTVQAESPGGDVTSEASTETPSVLSEANGADDSETAPVSFRTISIESAIADSSASTLVEPGTNLQLEPGLYELEGIPIDFDWTATTQDRDFPNVADTVEIKANIPLATEVYFLIQAGWGLSEYDQKQIGNIRLHFGNGVILEIPLILGENIRDWTRGESSVAVTTVTSPDVIPAWQGTALGRTGGMDLLKVSIPEQYQETALLTIEVIDTSTDTVLSLDPAIHLLAVTVGSSLKNSLDGIPSTGSQITWDIEPGEVLILTGGIMTLGDFECQGGGTGICVIIVKATEPQQLIISNVIAKNNWIGVSDVLEPEEILSGVQDGFWIFPNCGNGCSTATVGFFEDEQLVETQTILP